LVGIVVDGEKAIVVFASVREVMMRKLENLRNGNTNGGYRSRLLQGDSERCGGGSGNRGRLGICAHR
jgi:hypothetical protein